MNGNKQVFKVEINGRHFIIKFSRDWYNKMELLLNSDGTDIVTDISNKIEYLRSYSNRNFNLFMKNIKNTTNVTENLSQTGWLALMAMNEPFLLSFFNNSGWLVNFLGNCGGLYAVERVEYSADQVYGSDEQIINLLRLPDIVSVMQHFISSRSFHYYLTYIQHFITSNSFYYYLTLPFRTKPMTTCRDAASDIFNYVQLKLYEKSYQVKKPSFLDRVTYAEHLLNTFELFTKQTNSHLHLCDVHPGNFGVLSDGGVKLIDTDLLVTRPLLQDHLSNLSCVSDSECKYGYDTDCQSSCDIETLTCTTAVAKGNFQNLCHSVIPMMFHNLEQNETILLQDFLDTVRSFSYSGIKTLGNELEGIYTLGHKIKEVKASVKI